MDRCAEPVSWVHYRLQFYLSVGFDTVFLLLSLSPPLPPLPCVHPGSRVEAGAQVRQAILADGSNIRRGARLGRGCILSFGVIVGEGVCIPDFTRVSMRQRLVGDENEVRGGKRGLVILLHCNRFALPFAGSRVGDHAL